jgi:putative iron-regulated protein
MIGEDNAEGNKAINAAIRALIGQAKQFERAIAALKLEAIEFEGSDSLDDPAKVTSQ